MNRGGLAVHPTVGTYLGGALPVLIALLTDPADALWTLAFIVVYQQVENYLLSPEDHRPDDAAAPGGGVRRGDRRRRHPRAGGALLALPAAGRPDPADRT